MKVSGLLVAVAAGVLGFSALSAQAAPVALNLTLTVDQAAQTWQVSGNITGDTTRTLGLAGVQFSVVGAGGAVVTDLIPDPDQVDDPGGFIPATNILAPNGFVGSFAVGFNSVQSQGVGGAGINMAQANQYKSSGANRNILQNVGLAAATQYGQTWALPVVLADGQYTGSGTLHLVDFTGDTTFLPATLPTPSAAGAGFQTFSPDAVTDNGSVPVGVPEPASLGLLGLGSLLVLRRRRTA